MSLPKSANGNEWCSWAINQRPSTLQSPIDRRSRLSTDLGLVVSHLGGDLSGRRKSSELTFQNASSDSSMAVRSTARSIALCAVSLGRMFLAKNFAVATFPV